MLLYRGELVKKPVIGDVESGAAVRIVRKAASGLYCWRLRIQKCWLTPFAGPLRRTRSVLLVLDGHLGIPPSAQSGHLVLECHPLLANWYQKDSLPCCFAYAKRARFRRRTGPVNLMEPATGIAAR